jgi:hypothetical protein
MAIYSQEAFQKSRDHLAGTDTATSELDIALANFTADNWAELPIPKSPEAVEFVQRTKVERYAYLAAAIGKLLDYAFAQTSEDSPFSVDVPDTVIDPWYATKDQLSRKLRACVNQIKETDEYQRADSTSHLVGILTPGRHISAETQLGAGLNTSLGTAFPFFRNLPQISRHFSPATTYEELSGIAKHSSSLAHHLMRRSVNNLMASRSFLTFGKYWFDDALLDPDHFVPVFAQQKLYSVQFSSVFLEAASQLESDPSRQPSVIVGCPLALLHGSYKELWSRMVDTITTGNLWTVNQPELGEVPTEIRNYPPRES